MGPIMIVVSRNWRSPKIVFEQGSPFRRRAAKQGDYMATKANSKTGVAEGEDGGDAPLLDLNEASVKKLIARAKKRGYITYDELNDALPQDQMSSEQIEDIMAALNE